MNLVNFYTPRKHLTCRYVRMSRGVFGSCAPGERTSEFFGIDSMREGGRAGGRDEDTQYTNTKTPINVKDS